jgi:hypothetical protein
MAGKPRLKPDDLDELLRKDREDDQVEFTEDDIAFLQEMMEMTRDFN